MLISKFHLLIKIQSLLYTKVDITVRGLRGHEGARSRRGPGTGAHVTRDRSANWSVPNLASHFSEQTDQTVTAFDWSELCSTRGVLLTNLFHCGEIVLEIFVKFSVSNLILKGCRFCLILTRLY